MLAGLVVIGLLLLLPLTLGAGHAADLEPRSLSDVLTALNHKQLDGQAILWVTIDDNRHRLVLRLADSVDAAAHYPDGFAGTLVARLEASGVPFEATAVNGPSPWGRIAVSLLPALLLAGVLLYVARRAGSAGPVASSFTATKAAVGLVPTTRFADVVGVDEAVDELAEVVSFLHDPARFHAAGARMPRGFLLAGPPGTGKTLLARAVAGEAGVPFYVAAGSDFTELFVGVGAARIRDLFAKAKQTGGIVFLDELDSVGRARLGNVPVGGGTEERESTLNALLVEMDGFATDDHVIVIAATNRADILDPALLRAGRFDRQVTVAPPDRRGRTQLLALYTRARRLAADVDLVGLARRMPGLTGADIANVVNQAALEAARARREELHPGDFEEALATVMMGRARRSAVVTERDREVTAWHEAGHAVAALLLAEAHDPVQVTIVPRGPAGGVTWMAGDDDAFLTRSEAQAQLVVAMAGRAAEELLLEGDFTQGASGDLASATQLATRMVTAWGMSSLGLSAFDLAGAGPGLADRIQTEVDGLLEEALDTARLVVERHRALLEAVVAELLDEETVDATRLALLRSTVEAGRASSGQR